MPEGQFRHRFVEAHSSYMHCTENVLVYNSRVSTQYCTFLHIITTVGEYLPVVGLTYPFIYIPKIVLRYPLEHGQCDEASSGVVPDL